MLKSEYSIGQSRLMAQGRHGLRLLVFRAPAGDNRPRDPFTVVLVSDGEMPYARSLYPGLLAFASAVLSAVALPGHAPWSAPIELGEDGQATLAER
jgi:hypothetical protein